MLAHVAALALLTLVPATLAQEWNAEPMSRRPTLAKAGDRDASHPFTRDSWIWTEEAKLAASDGKGGDFFGWSVSLSGDTALAGASGDSDAGDCSGSAYVFARTGTVWSQEAKLTASDAAEWDFFGWSVSLSGITALVGAFEDDLGGRTDCGSAYVFVRAGTTWSEQAKLTARDASRYDLLGYSICIAGDTALAGAVGDGPGSAYVFVRAGTVWSQQVKLMANDAATGDEFGSSVSVWGDTALVGAHNDDDSGSESGSAYVFVRTGSRWHQQAKLTASDAAEGNWFGSSVSLYEGTALVGAAWDGVGSAYVFERSGTVWSQQAKLTPSGGGGAFGASVSLSQDAALIGAWNDGWGAVGAVYVFVRFGTTWSQQARLTASDADLLDRLGYSVSLCGDTALAGAPWAWNETSGPGEGAAYVFKHHLAPHATCQWYCGTSVNAATDGYVVTSPAVLGGTFSASVTGCAAGNVGAMLVGYSSSLTFMSPWGEVLVNIGDPNGELLGFPSGLGDPAVINLQVPSDMQFCGFTFYTQAASFFPLCLHCAYECTIGF